VPDPGGKGAADRNSHFPEVIMAKIETALFQDAQWHTAVELMNIFIRDHKIDRSEVINVETGAGSSVDHQYVRLWYWDR
jgi:hypothetical protein